MSDSLGLGFWLDVTSLVRKLTTQQETERLDNLWNSYRKAICINDDLGEADKLFEEIKEELANKAASLSLMSRRWKP